MFDFPASPANGQIFQPSSGAPAWQFDGTAWKTLVTAQGFRGPTRTVFTASGNYTPPTGCTSIDVEVLGGGGAGGGAVLTGAGQYSVGGGGSAGAWGKKLFNVNALTFPVAVTVGTGGTAVSGAAGNAGGTTSFASLSATGGGGGGASVASTIPTAGGPAGGVVSGGDLAAYGAAGGVGYGLVSATYITSGGGAASPFGYGGAALVNASAAGFAGAGYGSGGGGASNAASIAVAKAGGNGTPGAVIITEYYTGDATYRPTTAEVRNRIVNGAMQISQENASAAVNTSGGYPADQWVTLISGIVAAAQRSSGVPTPNSSTLYLSFGATTAKASLAAGDFDILGQHIEGIRLVDLAWGTAAARQAVLRFWVYATTAGTYSFAIQNSAQDRSYVANFTVPTAGVWTAFTFAIPGDTTGTWLKDTGIGARLYFTHAVGTTYQGSAGWQAGNKLGTSSTANGAATANNFLYLGDVGLYLDPANTGVAPPWTMPDEAQELAACLRYWQKFTNLVIDTSAVSQSITHLAPMRVAPSASGGGAGFTRQAGDNVTSQFYQTTRAYGTVVLTARM